MSVTAAQGFRAAGVCAGLKASGRPDLALVVNDGPLDVATGVFTTNRVVAAPVTFSRAAVADGHARAIILNSGCANACTGAQGSADTAATAARAAELLGLPVPTDVLVCSTGVIGHTLDMQALLAGTAAAVDALASTPQAGRDAATAIMTTDTVSKEDALTLVTSDGVTWSLGGMIKGVGMLAPGLATMLCVLTTDAVIDPDTARDALAHATARTVNRVNSDGCMSTNDTVLLLASGACGATPSRSELDAALTEILGLLGRRLVADAEGATHDIAITVSGAVSEAAAEAAARSVASSNLLKCAVAGEDPNWGRVLSQLGTVPAEVCPFDPDEVDVAINGVTVFSHGGLGQDPATVDMTPRETRIDITLAEGGAEATVWTNDLTHGYVTINADYHT
ncbi:MULTISPECIES: bifunctional glutamate N-acetyltransferase/amino-acid acetyltransferase ArgJ [Actinomyces]|uniref:Arginine biosynthesis bifunctional protein ArgJ n=1 Tax=Actinomyces respiraculi TaxID=2744574 RepID=A0A7T0PX11_9ACTO|nr:MULTISPECIES: bifunctional glutamate N-acetyltransferase/amino-acid acetyltransferase ArgJ [Actinomyces]QPL06309.1 bifunctional glutamate N-acetyltransferase/amino-acid acetyltransferase ArgJ [Actinomyces respiraculi]